MFETEVYLSRRAKLKQRVQQGLLLFLGNEESPMNYEANTYHFRQDSSFLYYFGISAPGLAAIIDLDQNTEMMFGNEMNIDDLVWTGQLETLEEKCLKAGVKGAYPVYKLSEVVKRAKDQDRLIHFLPPYRAENKIKLQQLLGLDLNKIKVSASVEFVKAVVEQRSVKSAEEVEEIEKAVNISVKMHKLAMLNTKPGSTESEVAAMIHEAALKDGGNLAYPIILTKNGHILHNYNRIHTLTDGDLVLNDSGAETALGYCGDLTRTFPAGKKFSERQKEIYEIVLDSLTSASEALKPNTRYLDVHFTACKKLTEGLKDLGLMKGDPDEAVAAGAHAMFFQCGTGHMMGMDVHDMEDLGEEYVGYNDSVKKETELFGLKSLRLGKELQPGFVLTVEPGIYFNPYLIDLWKAEKKHREYINYELLEEYRHFGGIRIEDNFLITNDGARVLGQPLQKTISEIEAMRAIAF